MSEEPDAPDVGTSEGGGKPVREGVAASGDTAGGDAISERIEDATADWLTPARERFAELSEETIQFLRETYVQWKVEGKPVIRDERTEYREAADIGLLVWTGSDNSVPTYTFADTAENISTEWGRAVLEAVRRRNMERNDAARRALLGTAPSKSEGETSQPKDERPVPVEELVRLFAAEDGTVEFWAAEKTLSGYSRERISLGFNAGKRDGLFVSTARGYTLTDAGKEKWRELKGVEDKPMPKGTSAPVFRPVMMLDDGRSTQPKRKKDSNPAGNTMSAASGTATKEEPLKTSVEPAKAKNLFGPKDHFVEGKRIPVPLRLILLYEMTEGKGFRAGDWALFGKDVPSKRQYTGLSHEDALRVFVCKVNENKLIEKLLGARKMVITYNDVTHLYEWRCDPHDFIPKFDFNPEDYIVRVPASEMVLAKEPVMSPQPAADSEEEVDIEYIEIDEETDEPEEVKEPSEAGEADEEDEHILPLVPVSGESGSLDDRVANLERALAETRSELEAANRDLTTATTEVEQVTKRLGELVEQYRAVEKDRDNWAETARVRGENFQAQSARVQELEAEVEEAKKGGGKAESSTPPDLVEIIREILSPDGDVEALRAENIRLRTALRALAAVVARGEHR